MAQKNPNYLKSFNVFFKNVKVRESVLSGKVSKFNWLGPADITLFCSLKETIISFYGRDSLKSFENQLVEKLSSRQKTPSQEIRRRSILSENCALYSS